MLQVTPQERLALGVTALLLAAGAASRLLSAGPSPAEWQQELTPAADTGSDVSLSALRAASGREVAREKIRGEPLASGERIDVNTASADQLDRLPRVGPDLAAKIVAWRDSHGRFGSLAELDSVPGVGPALLREAAPHLSLPAARTSAIGRTPSTPPGAEPAREKQARMEKVDLNRATAEELDALQGIGPVLAQRIIDWRAKNGRFGTIDDLEKVPGIGPAMLKKLAPSLRLGP